MYVKEDDNDMTELGGKWGIHAPANILQLVETVHMNA